MKTGRNDACPCGSGKKYKQCCLPTEGASAADDLTWRRVRRAIESLPKMLTAEAARRFGEQGHREARAEFFSFAEDATQLEGLQSDAHSFDPLFFSFFFFDWLPDPQTTKLPKPVLGLTAANACLTEPRRRLDPIAQRYLEACTAASTSFYDVLEVRTGAGVRLREMLSGDEIDVIEKTASRSVQVGDVLYAKIVEIEGIRLVECMGPVAVPPRYKPEIIDLRKALKGGRRRRIDAGEHAPEMRALYLSIAASLLHPRMPELHNTDGDPFESYTLVFDLDAPDAAAKMLGGLTAGVAEPALQYDQHGKFVGAEIPWMRPGNEKQGHSTNTVLGVIRIKGARLMADVNSERRAAMLRKLIEERLGAAAHVRPSIVRSVGAMLNDASPPDDGMEDENAESAELQAMMTQYLRNHYRAWVDSSIPALGGKTPRAAVRTRDGREAVTALVDDLERNGARMKPPLDPDIVRELRDTLKL